MIFGGRGGGSEMVGRRWVGGREVFFFFLDLLIDWMMRG